MNRTRRDPLGLPGWTLAICAAVMAPLYCDAPALAQGAAQTFKRQTTEFKELNRAISKVPVAEVPTNRAAGIPADAVRTEVTEAADRVTLPAGTVGERGEAPAAPAPSMKPGRLYYAAVTPQLESQIKTLVEPTVRQLAGDQPIATVPGVVRVLSRGGEEVQFKPYVFFGDRLKYSTAEKKFLGSIFVGVAPIGENRDPKELSAPVIFQVLESYVSPQELRVTNTSPPYLKLQVSLDSFDEVANAANVRILTTYSQDVMSLAIPVAPTIIVHTTNDVIQGYGLGTTPVAVTVIGVPDPEGRKVTLTGTPRATFEPAEVVLDASGTASSILRSDGLGPVTISASLMNANAIPRVVTFEPPTETLGAGIIGGIGGALIRLLPRAGKMRKRNLLLGILVAVLIGLLVFGLYAIGVSLLPIEPTVRVGAIVVLVISAVGAYLGTTALRGLQPAS